MFSRGQVKYEIYQRLNKDPSTRGFYSDTKCESAITESVDWIGTEMLIADDGWLKKVDIFDTPASMTTFELHRNMSMISQVLALVGNVYVPLMYDSQFDMSQWSPASGAVQFPSRYRIVDNRLYFNPPIATGGAGFLQIEYLSMPKIMRDDTDKLEPFFDRYCIWFMVYNSMSIMAESMRQYSQPWAARGQAWYARMVELLNKRVLQSVPIVEFEGY